MTGEWVYMTSEWVYMMSEWVYMTGEWVYMMSECSECMQKVWMFSVYGECWVNVGVVDCKNNENNVCHVIYANYYVWRHCTSLFENKLFKLYFSLYYKLWIELKIKSLYVPRQFNSVTL